VIAINETWRMAPWAEALYACDARWWVQRGPSAAEFRGLRVLGFDGDGVHWSGVRAGVRRGISAMVWRGRALGAGGNSGFQAMNFAARCGATKIVLTGFDMALGPNGAAHWHADHAAPSLTNPEAGFLRRCAHLLDGVAVDLAARGVAVINASRQTALTAYPRANLQEALS
jgi:hypothetical protein